ncbi:MAG: immunoglobulin domain-containing protein [Labilithrix sp.]|nr:immunoglobulin domain-containing protein [Labilithrix sp.]
MSHAVLVVRRPLVPLFAFVAFFVALVGWTATAQAQSYPLRRPQTPNTWMRPEQACPNAPAGPERVFNVLSIRVPGPHGNTPLNVTATRVSGTGIALDVYQGFGGYLPGWHCVNQLSASAYSTGSSVTLSTPINNPTSGTNFLDIVISGNGPADTGAFTISYSIATPSELSCQGGAFSPASQTGISSTGASFSTVFTPAPGCGTWNMTDVPGWVSGFSTTGTGTTTINYTVAANGGSSRSASISGGVVNNANRTTFAVSQLAAGQTCSLSLGSTSATPGSAGGTSSFNVSASNAACGWNAVSNAAWITNVTSGGTGSGTVNYTVAANTGVARTGTITAAGQTFTVTQGHGCTVSLDPTSRTTAAAGGTSSFGVVTGAGCPWTVSENTSWLTGVTASGSGPGNVSYTVGANTDAARSAPIAVTNGSTGASTNFTVNQSAGCAITLTPASASPGNGGGASSFSVTTGAGCAWTASATASWLNGVTGSGTSSGTVNYSVDANVGVARSAAIQVTATATNASSSFSVSQGDGCTASINPSSVTRGAAGGAGSFAITMSSPTCPWTAMSNSPFISGVTGSGTGSGTINFNVAANPGVARSGTITVNGLTFTVNQDSGCTASLDPTSATPSAAGGNASFGILMSDASCAWTASTATPWLGSVTVGGTGSSTVSYVVQPNTGPARSGRITAGGRTFAVDQASGCTVTLPVASGNVGSGGGNSSFLVDTAAGCGFTAVSSEAWVTTAVTATGVDFTAQPSSSASRTATVTVSSTSTASSATFTITQASGCVLALSAAGATPTSAGGAASFGVTSGAGCTWTATSADPWVQSVTVTAVGVDYGVDANTGAARTGTIVVTNPQTGTSTSFAVAQASGCSVALPTNTGTVPVAGGAADFAVTSGAGCVVTSSSTASWLSNFTTNGGTVAYAAAANTGAARSGIVEVTTADTGSTASYTVEQGSGCTVSLPVASASVVATGATSSFLVTTGDACVFTATSPDSWLSGVTVSATGVSFTAAANAAVARTGTIVVTSSSTSSTETFTIHQDGAVTQPAITTQPANVTVDEGESFSLSVVATGGSLFYQWRKNGDDVPGANAATFTVSSAALTDAGNYDVVISNAAGTVTSTVAVVTVRPRPEGSSSGGTSSGGTPSIDGGTDLANGFGVSPAGGGCSCDTARGRASDSGWFAAVGLGIALVITRRRRST